MTAFTEKLSAAAAEYLRRLRMENLTPKTLDNYERVISAFTAFCAETGQDDEFVAVVAWKTKLFENGASPATIKQYLIDLQIFFKAAAHRSYPQQIRFGENPIDTTLMPKVPQRPYEIVLTDDQVMKLFANCPPAPGYKNLWPRNWCIVMLALNEKIRNAEILDLKLSDIDMLHHVLVVESGKGRKYREVDLTPLTEFAITQYLDSGIRPAYLSDDDYLFGTDASHTFGNNGEPKERWHRGTKQWVTEMIERTVAAITGVHDVRSHDLRHVGSRICLNAGQSMELLQGQLGHSQIATTQIYTSRMNSRRGRDSAKAVLAARDEAAEKLFAQYNNDQEQAVIPLFA